MRMHCARVADDRRLESSSENEPGASWLHDGVIRWLDVESAEQGAVNELLAPLAG